MTARIPMVMALLLSACALPAVAQYPKVPKAVQKAENERRAAYEKPEDEAWQKAQPELEAWAKKGKPYLPWAAKPSDLPQAKIPAFPGAWGGGMHSFGGRGGKVFVVTSLDDAGPGTLREACNAIGPRIVVFNIAGTIHLKNRIRIRAPYITIAGQTAPGDGICVRGATFGIDTHDVVIRYLRFRRGETNVANRDDSLGGNPVGNIVIDHCSASWGLDENMSLYRHMYRPKGGDKDEELKLPTVNITVQWCISSEGLDTYNHAFGSTLGGHNSVFHHNLWACNSGRNPSIGMDGGFNFANNVLYNWRHRAVDGGDQRSRYNIVNNYFKPGPATQKSQVSYRVLRPDGHRAGRDKKLPLEWGRAYVSGNVVEGNKEVTKDNWNGGVQIKDGDPKVVLPKVRTDKPFPMAEFPLQSATESYMAVLANAGATLPRRDPVDRRIIEQVRKGTVPEGTKQGIITDVKQVGGYPEYKGVAVKDRDGDGIPDDWELKYGLDPNDPKDSTLDKDGDGYANIEEYLNGTDPTAYIDYTKRENNTNTLRAGKGATAIDDAMRKKIDHKAARIVEALKLTDAGKAAKVKTIAGDWLAVMMTWHKKHDADLKRMWGEWNKARSVVPKDEFPAEVIAHQIDAVYASLKPAYEDYIKRLSAELTARQVDEIKERWSRSPGMTRTYNAYLKIVPDLTAKDKEVIEARMLMAREAAMLTDADKEIVAIYKRHKVKVEQYIGTLQWTKLHKAFAARGKSQASKKK